MVVVTDELREVITAASLSTSVGTSDCLDARLLDLAGVSLLKVAPERTRNMSSSNKTMNTYGFIDETIRQFA